MGAALNSPRRRQRKFFSLRSGDGPVHHQFHAGNFEYSRPIKVIRAVA